MNSATLQDTRHKSIVFPYTDFRHMDTKIKTTVPFINSQTTTTKRN